MTITIHLGSFFGGFLTGIVLMGFLVCWGFLRDGGMWSMGFHKGWQSGSDYQKKIQTEDKRADDSSHG